MSILDPRTPHLSRGVKEVASQIPFLTPELYNFGFIPDVSRIMPGDLILVSKIEPGLSGRLIKKSQGLLFASGCEWTHAAIYIRDYTIIEANPFRGIHKNVIFAYVPGYKICVRRLKQLQTLEREEAYVKGLQVALDAAMRMPWSWYPLKWLLSFIANCLAKPIAKFNLNKHIKFANYHVCSSLFAACAMERHGINVVSSDALSSSLNVCPAMLRHSSQLEDIDVGWSKLSNPDGVLEYSISLPVKRHRRVWLIVGMVGCSALLAWALHRRQIL